jgi:hypothetical protein
MPRPKQITPKVHLHITISADLRKKLDKAVWSELEQRIPAGALQKFIEERLREYFSQEKLDTSQYILGGGVVCGESATLEMIRDFLTEYAETEI